jgi:hypothetical protein
VDEALHAYPLGELAQGGETGLADQAQVSVHRCRQIS